MKADELINETNWIVANNLLSFCLAALCALYLYEFDLLRISSLRELRFVFL